MRHEKSGIAKESERPGVCYSPYGQLEHLKGRKKKFRTLLKLFIKSNIWPFTNFYIISDFEKFFSSNLISVLHWCNTEELLLVYISVTDTSIRPTVSIVSKSWMAILLGHIKWYRGLLAQSLLFPFSVDKQTHKTELTDVITQENEREKTHNTEELKKF